MDDYDKDIFLVLACKAAWYDEKNTIYDKVNGLDENVPSKSTTFYLLKYRNFIIKLSQDGASLAWKSWKEDQLYTKKHTLMHLARLPVH